ncbi:MAG: gamma-glutamyltransferase family protein [Actinomycetes bacterium]
MQDDLLTRPELVGTYGMVTSTHWLASQCGMAVLEAGGNAFDAATAAGLVLQVVEPHLNGPGGEVPIIAWDGRAERPFVVCGQGTAPERATPDAFDDLGLDLIPGTGLLPTCVPGAYGAWMLLLRRWGSMRLRDVLRYAIDYAGGGYPVLPGISAALRQVQDHFTTHWPSSAQVWLSNGGRVPASGAMMRNPTAAETYARILREAEAASSDRDEQIEAARRVFYEGFVVEAIADFAETELMDVSGRPHRGLITYEDMASWRPRIEEPVTLDYHGYTVCKAGPWTQGPVFLQQLRLLEHFDVSALGPSSPELIHTVVECAKLAFADREAFYGDPDTVDVPLTDLLSPSYAEARTQLLDPTQAWSAGLRPGSPGQRRPALPHYPRADDYPADAAAGVVGGRTSDAERGMVAGDTCHVDVVDRFGNMVSATPSGGWLQSSPVVPGLGFPLSTRCQMFWLEPGLANTLAGGKRPRTTLTPSLVLRGGSPYLAFGTPGGDQQDQWSLLFFLRHVHHGLNLQEAVDAPCWHTTDFPSSFYPRASFPGRLHAETRVGEATMANLRRRGHEVVAEGAWSLGHMTAASRTTEGVLRAAANPRGAQAYAVGR